MIFLEAQHLDRVHHILQRWVPNYEVWAFGSRVHRRGLKPFSDLDIVLISDSPLDVSLYGKIKEAFSESDLPIRVDIADWNLLSNSFKEMIRLEHERIQ
ncbi:MAG: nucleotidyltransferase domain-containing protein [Gammaproteobacteria bacterium]|nr:MAG: nucleotidyltransferase domain-containing protein [Gammaproteobacteria bacterium]RKZ44795.1 MAG: nucleotidyltransferase domain-containing protein [Gammaproteobacteria bacterium]RKZ73839.1 MAG: nucleotidyltransferase domain-containing protein [Gammaproteobacteria bacterium]